MYWCTACESDTLFGGGFPLDYGAFAPCEVDAGETCVNASCVPPADSGAD
jgi:hypothetical protein